MLSIQVNFRAIIKNIITVKKRLKPGTKFCAVVKSNAYGFGLSRISKLIEPYVDCFAVGNLDEGITLRQNGIQKDILILGITNDIPTAIKNNLIISLNSLQQANDLVKNNWLPRLHIAVNTDLNRYGLNTIHELRTILKLLPNAKIEGIYTHLAYETPASRHLDQALTQFKKFVYICKQSYPNVLVHAGCSGTIDYPAAHFQMMRIGKAMYGGTANTQTVFTISAPIVAVKKVKMGDTIGYQGTYTAPKAMLVGIIPAGYADGITMAFSGTTLVTVNQKLCPVIGRVCMNSFFIDVTHINKPLRKRVLIIAPRPGQTLLDAVKQTRQIACNLLLGFRFSDYTNTNPPIFLKPALPQVDN